MTEETTETLETTQTETQETPSEVSLLPEETQEPTGDAPIPEGLDADIFDTETRTLKESAVIERLKQNQTDIERYKKQANDMRRKLGKGRDIPEKLEEYAEGYMPEERYEQLFEDEGHIGDYIRNRMSSIEEIAYEHGLTKTQTNAFKDAFLRELELLKAIDCRTVEEKERDRINYIQEQKGFLGDNADNIINENKKFYTEYGFFSNLEKEYIQGEIKKSGAANSVYMKFRRLFGENTSHDIPTRGVAVSGLADDETLAREYYDNKTSDTRRMQILQQRIDAGRSGGLPLVY